MDRKITSRPFQDIKAFHSRRKQFEAIEKGWYSGTCRIIFEALARASNIMVMLRGLLCFD